jgi:hypothetical protein
MQRRRDSVDLRCRFLVCPVIRQSRARRDVPAVVGPAIENAAQVLVQQHPAVARQLDRWRVGRTPLWYRSNLVPIEERRVPTSLQQSSSTWTRATMQRFPQSPQRYSTSERAGLKGRLHTETATRGLPGVTLTGHCGRVDLIDCGFTKRVANRVSFSSVARSSSSVCCSSCAARSNASISA